MRPRLLFCGCCKPGSRSTACQKLITRLGDGYFAHYDNLNRLHSIVGATVIRPSGSGGLWLNGDRHQENSPAVIRKEKGGEGYWIQGWRA